ncbi:hypothetical protein C9374_010235 [Naegleria lovaniensis]|uniref:DNA (cytosine-5-)-methyltransferase n=1 Tax=Naegleria lovaniensis TaxID=51637 RepID=A0AA88GE39_NAELO|nr:uncharacterized protein C9374_010235 [Naegleria lovaniensis]KAG2374861.1 hypothetical protein C9374_010235 [Naegleria lovaniensis]
MSQEKNKQILTFINFVDYFKPKYVLMENVTGMLMNSDVFDVPKFIISKFKDIGYDIRISVFNAIHFGIPQSRSRLFFLGQRTSTTNLNTHCTIQFPIPTHAGRVNSSVPNVFKSLLYSYPNAIQSGSMPPVNLRDYICDLKPLEENDSHPRNVNSDHHSKDVNHSYPREALTVYQKIARRGCDRLTNMEYREYNNSFLTKSVIRCLPRRSGATIEDLEFDSLRIAISKKQKSKKSFKRLEWSKPSSCIVSNMSVTHFEFIHPTENRILSIRECARIQGFPDTFEFVDDQGPLCRSQKLKEKYTQIGNAVPVVFGFQFGIEIRKAFIKSTQPNDHSMVQHHISIISEQLERILKESSENANRTIAEWSEQDFEISNDLREGTTLEFRKAEKEFHNSDEFVSQFLNVQLEQPSSSLSMDEDSDDHMVENDFEGSPLV